MNKTSTVVFWIEPPDPNAFFPSLQPSMCRHAADLGEALKIAENMRREGKQHVCISSENSDCVTKPGVDSVEGGKTPDGHDYTWKKRRV